MIVDPRLGWGNAVLLRRLGDVQAMPPMDVQDPIHFQQEAQKAIFAAQGEVEQSWGQLSQASSAGLPDSKVMQHQAKLQMLAQQLSQLQSDAAALKQTNEMKSWATRADAVILQVHQELQTVVSLNQSAITGGTYKGLMLGLGVAAAVATLGFIVWKKRSRRKK